MPGRGSRACEAPTAVAVGAAPAVGARRKARPCGDPKTCGSVHPWEGSASPLDRTGGQAADEVPLQGQEDDDRKDHRDDAARSDEILALALLADEVVLHGDGQRGVLAWAD